MKRVRSNLKHLADSRGFDSVRELARAVKYRYETVRQMYNDETRQYPQDLLDKLCTFFDCDISELLIVEEVEEESQE